MGTLNTAVLHGGRGSSAQYLRRRLQESWWGISYSGELIIALNPQPLTQAESHDKLWAPTCAGLWDAVNLPGRRLSLLEGVGFRGLGV